MTSHFQIYIIYFIIVLENPTEFRDLTFSNLHILLYISKKSLSHTKFLNIANQLTFENQFTLTPLLELPVEAAINLYIYKFFHIPTFDHRAHKLHRQFSNSFNHLYPNSLEFLSFP